MKSIKPYYESIFNIAVQETILELDIAALIEFCYEIQRKNPEGVVKSNIGGWQSDDVLHETHEEFIKLKNKIVEAANLYHRWIDFDKSAVQKINNIWININQKGHGNLFHQHPGCVFSGAFYLNAPSPIVFQHPYEPLSTFYWPAELTENWNRFNSGQWELHSSPNTLLLFPPWLFHMVAPHKEDEDRISLSFNTDLEGTVR